MVVKATNYNKQIEEIVKKNDGYITLKEAKEKNILSAVVFRFVKKNNFYKDAPGIYSSFEGALDELYIYQKRYPKIVYSFYCAQYLNRLGDGQLYFYEATVPKNYRSMNLKDKRLRIHTETRDEIYNLGIIEITTEEGFKVRYYDREKTVCDFIRFRERLDAESFNKCMYYYRDDYQKIDINKLYSYAKKMNIYNKIRDIMLLLLNED